MQFSTFSHGQRDKLIPALLPTLQTLIRPAMTDAMTMQDFAVMLGISEYLVWQRLDEGLRLNAPTREHTDAGKRSRTLINVKAWRDKLMQQAIGCHDIVRHSATSFS